MLLYRSSACSQRTCWQGLERFRVEYEKLHRALKKSHESEKRLIKKCRELNTEIVSNAAKAGGLLRTSTRLILKLLLLLRCPRLFITIHVRGSHACYRFECLFPTTLLQGANRPQALRGTARTIIRHSFPFQLSPDDPDGCPPFRLQLSRQPLQLRWRRAAPAALVARA